MRVQNTTIVSRQIKTDLDAIIDSHPEGFDVVLFKAVSSNKESIALVEDDVVGSLESKERTLDYEAPIVVAAMEPQQDIRSYQGFSSGDGYGLLQDEGQYKLLISGTVPKYSVLAFAVQQHDDTYSLRVMYVIGLRALGRKAPVGYIYNLIPYAGGDHQMDDVLPDENSIVDYVANILDTMTPPEIEETEPETDPETDGFELFDPEATP